MQQPMGGESLRGQTEPEKYTKGKDLDTCESPKNSMDDPFVYTNCHLPQKDESKVALHTTQSPKHHMEEELEYSEIPAMCKHLSQADMHACTTESPEHHLDQGNVYSNVAAMNLSEVDLQIHEAPFEDAHVEEDVYSTIQ